MDFLLLEGYFICSQGERKKNKTTYTRKEMKRCVLKAQHLWHFAYTIYSKFLNCTCNMKCTFWIQRHHLNKLLQNKMTTSFIEITCKVCFGAFVWVQIWLNLDLNNRLHSWHMPCRGFLHLCCFLHLISVYSAIFTAVFTEVARVSQEKPSWDFNFLLIRGWRKRISVQVNFF